MSARVGRFLHRVQSWIGLSHRPRRGRLSVEVLERRDTPAVTPTDAPAFALAVDAGDNVGVLDNGGQIAWTVNGVLNTGATATANVTSISITASGAFASTIDLSAVTRAAFTALTSVAVSAGAGDDTIVGSAFNGLIAGQGGNDTVRFDGSAGAEAYQLGTQSGALIFTRTGAAPVQHTITGSETFTLNAADGNDTLTVQNLAGVASLATVNFDGGAGSDTAIGPDLANTWTILSTTNLGFSGFAGLIQFASTENLIGGNLADTFRPFDGFGVAGSIDGNGDIDVIDYSIYTTPVTVNLQTGAASSIGGGLSNVENVNGGRAGDSLIGDGLRNVLQGNQGDDNINGGAGDDLISWRASHGSDTIDGGPGSDLVDLSSDDVAETFQVSAQGAALVIDRVAPTALRLIITGSEAVQLFANGGADTFIVGNLATVAGVATLVLTGVSDSDTIVGPDLPTTWNLNGTGSGTIVSSGGFAGVLRFFADNITGGAADDIFRLDYGCLVPGRLDGGAGFDTLDYTLFRDPVAVDLNAGTATNIEQGIVNIENIVPNNFPGSNDPNSALVVSTAPPVNIVPRRIVIAARGRIRLSLRITDRDKRPGRMRVQLAAPAGRFLVDRRLLRRIRGLTFRLPNARNVIFTGSLPVLNRALRLITYEAPARRGTLSLIMTTRELDAGRRSKMDRDVIRVFVR